MIGILSGMGAAAGVHVLDVLIKECQRQGAKEDNSFPEIVLYSLPAAGMNEQGIANDNMIRTELAAGIEILNKAGATVIIMACNTVHIYRDMLQKKSAALILDMPAAAVRACKGASKVGVLSSHTMRELGVYDKAVHRIIGAECITVSEFEQGAVDKVVGHIIAGTVEGRHEIAMKSMVSDMIQSGAEKVILGCTELPLLPLHFNPGILVDPAHEVVKEALAL